MTERDALDFANEWIAAWNSHDLDAILVHYEEGVVLTSPVAAARLPDASGIVRGKAALRAYFEIGLRAFPELHFALRDVLIGMTSVVLYYVNHRGTLSAEFMEFGSSGKVSRVVAHYAGGTKA